MVAEIRDIYLEAARTAVQLLDSRAVGSAWDAESVLAGMSVGALAGHLARSVLQVEWFLDGDVAGTDPVSPVTTRV